MKKLLSIVISAITLGVFADAGNTPMTFELPEGLAAGTQVTLVCNGEVVHTTTTTSASITYSTEGLAAGEYWLELAGDPITESLMIGSTASAPQFAMAKYATITEGEIAVGKQLIWSNAQFVGQTGYSVAGGDYSNPKLLIPAQEGLPAGTTLRIDEISFAKRSDRDSTVKNYMLIGSQTDTTKASDQVVVSEENTLGGQTRYTYTFTENTVNVTVGSTATQMYFQTTAGSGNEWIQLQVVTKNADNTAVYQDTGFAQWCIIHELKATVVSFPAREPIDYEYNVSTSTWTPSDPAGEFLIGDTVSYTGEGTVVISSPITVATTIGSGVTLELNDGASVSRSLVTNNGKIRINGGTEAAPIEIIEDGPVHSSIERVEIAENSCVKMFAKGSGNRDYDVHGVSAATSTVILDSDHDWGMSYTSERQAVIRNCKIIVTHKFWYEQPSMIDSTCDLVANAVIVIGHGQENKTFEIGNLSGTGSFSPTGAPTLIVNQTANANYTNLTTPKMIIKVIDGTPTLPDSWAGTVQVTNDSETEKALYANNLGKNGSTVEIVGRYKGYLWGTTAFNPTLKIGEGATFEISNGSSTTTSTVPALVGSGTIKATWGNIARYQFADVSNWTGTILSKASVFSTADSCDKVFVKSETADEDGYYTYTLVAKSTGPESIDDITVENVMDVVPEAAQAIDATALVAWIKAKSGISTIEGLQGVNVDAFLMNASNDTTELVIDENTLAAVLAGDLDALKAIYPNAKVEVKDVTKSICGEGETNTHLYKLELSLPTAQD